jgi:hypothetical protein
MVECCDFCGLPADYEPSATAPLIAALEQAGEALGFVIPENVALFNPQWPDDTILPVDIELGELRKCASALATITAELAKHKGAGDGQG